jgi:multidrug efflux pump subunit AcrA (membrane-fusion protein)
VPRSSLVQRGALTGVYVIDGERAWLRWLTPGRGDAESVEVLSGLDAGMRVVADPRGLTDGARVTTRTAGAVQEPR